MERVEDTKTVKPQCMLVYGRSVDWDDNELKSLRILNAAYHQLHIITYDQLLMRAKLLLGIENETADEEEDFSEWRFKEVCHSLASSEPHLGASTVKMNGAFHAAPLTALPGLAL